MSSLSVTVVRAFDLVTKVSVAMVIFGYRMHPRQS